MRDFARGWIRLTREGLFAARATAVLFLLY